MPNLKNIKDKIRSVKNTEKTTRAMKLVSNVKLKKAKDVALYSSAYAIEISNILNDLSSRIKNQLIECERDRFVDTSNKIKVVDLVFITSDKGLCGGFNIRTIKIVKDILAEYKSKNLKIRLIGIGKKGIEYFKFQGVEIYEEYVGISSSPTYEKARNIMKPLTQDFIDGKTDKIIIVYNGYKNMIAQEIRINNLLPIEPSLSTREKDKEIVSVEFEPFDDGHQILNSLIKKYIDYSLYYSLVDSLAAEHSSRMNAMENATNNAKERVGQLDLEYNKARQSSITTELIEIISGVEAMK